jgi:hypothetical protein
MNRTLSGAMLTFLGLGLAGCGSMMGSPAWFADHSAGKASLARKAAFDLGCTEDKLEFTCLGHGGDCTSVGVVGCEHKATYVFREPDWVMNSSTKP